MATYQRTNKKGTMIEVSSDIEEEEAETKTPNPIYDGILCIINKVL
jgi:hypothetical protein